MDELYQIGLPIGRLSTVFMLWDSYERPCKILVSAARTEGWAVVELRNTILSSAIVDAIPVSKLHIAKEPIKIFKL